MSIYSEEHYITKLERNANVVGQVPEYMRAAFIANINTARNRLKGIEALDPDVRDAAYKEISEMLDDDYEKAGFELQKPNEETQEETKAPVR